MYKKGAGNDKQGKDAGNRTLCMHRTFSQAIKLRTFVRFENPPLLKIWKVSVFIFSILSSLTLNKMMVTEVKRS